jgi:hypothetical protein
MLYRVLIGLIPTVLIALFMTGAVPMGSMLPASEYRSSAVRAEDKTGDAGSAANLPRAAMTPGQVTEVFDGVDASLDAEIKRRAPEEKRRKERLQRERMGEWAPEGGGWGR